MTEIKYKWLEELEKTCSNIVKNFSEIKEEELKLEYDPFANGQAFISFLDDNSKQKRYSPIIVIGQDLLRLDDTSKEAVIAHEIGHYCRMKNYSAKRLERISGWLYLASSYNETHADIDYFKHKINRIQKWADMNEINADSKAFDAGYGKQVLHALKQTLDTYDESLSMIGKKNIIARIKNIEEKLKDGAH